LNTHVFDVVVSQIAGGLYLYKTPVILFATLQGINSNEDSIAFKHTFKDRRDFGICY
jgi:hypothetical protein